LNCHHPVIESQEESVFLHHKNAVEWVRLGFQKVRPPDLARGRFESLSCHYNPNRQNRACHDGDAPWGTYPI